MNVCVDPIGDCSQQRSSLSSAFSLSLSIPHSSRDFVYSRLLDCRFFSILSCMAILYTYTYDMLCIHVTFVRLNEAHTSSDDCIPCLTVVICMVRKFLFLILFCHFFGDGVVVGIFIFFFLSWFDVPIFGKRVSHTANLGCT